MKRLTPIFKWLPIFCGCLLAAVGIGAFVYSKWMPPDGYIVLKYDGMSTSGVFFWLENRSSRAIYTEGSGNEVWDSRRLTSCKGRGDISENSDPLALVDGYQSTIRVSPGERIRLKIETKLPGQYIGGSCRLRLSLLGGVFIESEEFRPQ